MKKIITTFVLLVLLGAGFYYFYIVKNSQTTQTVTTTTVDKTIVNGAFPAQAQNSTSILISIKNFHFNPQTTTIKPGTKVTWINNDPVAHTVTSDSGYLLNSETIAAGESFTFTFNDTGAAKYHCSIHPAMRGEIVVQN